MKIKYLCLFLILPFLFCVNVKADYKATVLNDEGDNCSIKNSHGNCFYNTTSLNSVGYIYSLDSGDEINVITSMPTIQSTDTNLCSDYYVYSSYYFPSNYTTYYGYYCNSKLATSSVLTDELKQEFTSAGFPESYFEKLAILKTAHPNWTFKAINTGLDFYTVVDNENTLGRSLIQVTDTINDVGYLNTWSGSYNYYTDTFNSFDGSNWFAANRDTIAYYLDPRNFLIDMYIFQFESLAYDSSVIDDKYISAISKIFGQDYLSNFTSNFLNAGKLSLTSPIYLASLSYQEVSGKSSSITGERSDYPGIYNFYNIGAYSGTDPVANGLSYASASNEEYLLPWNTVDRAITGGAKWIAHKYISIGQNTIYLKKWDLIASGGYYNHQYQTNIQAPSSEGNTTFKSYSSIGMLDSSFVFYIPVYNNMPSVTTLPNTGSPNNYLSNLNINGSNVVGFDGAITEYNYNLDINNPSITIDASKVNSNASIEGLGTFEINENCTKTITVTAQNGDVKKYNINITLTGVKKIDAKDVVSTLNNTDIKNGDKYLSGFTLGNDISIIKDKILNVRTDATVVLKNSSGEEKNSGVVATGDKVIITVGSDTKEYEALIYGDINGDGEINAIDFNRIKKYMLNAVDLSGVYSASADINGDGEINAIDFNRIKKYMLGDSTKIVQ